jgi:hypothetical protein
MHETKLYIERLHNSDSIRIWIIRHECDCDLYYNLDTDGVMIETRIENGRIATELKPFLELPRRFGETFLKGISDYNNTQGIITENENLLKGKLQATELHLADMRDLVKKYSDWHIYPSELRSTKDIDVRKYIKD